MGLPHTATSHLVNVIDFGLARRYRDPLTSEHVAWRRDRGEGGERRHGVGTSLFASLNAHRGIGEFACHVPLYLLTMHPRVLTPR